MPKNLVEFFLFHLSCFQEPFWNTRYIQNLIAPKQGRNNITLHKTCINHQIIELLSFLFTFIDKFKHFKELSIFTQELENNGIEI